MSESDPRAINIWNIASRGVFQVLGGHIGEVTDLAFSPGGPIVASASDDKTIDLFDLSELHPLARRASTEAMVAVRPDGRLFANAEQSGRISLWDIENHRRLGLLRHRARWVLDIAFSPSGRLLGSLYTPGTSLKADIWNSNSGQLVATLALEGKISDVALVFSPDDEQLIVISNNRADLWSIAQRRRLTAPWSRAEKVTSAAFSADGKRLAWVSNNSVTIWDWTTNRRLGVINNIAGGRDIALSHDGSLLVTSGDDVILWDANRQTRLGILGKGYRAVFSPDGQLVAAVGQQSDSSDDSSKSIPIWDTGARVQLAKLSAQGEYSQISFSSDGKLIAAGDIIELKDLHPTLAFQHLCNAVGRELTKSEWKAFLPGREYHELCQ
jgi:WD40 repeat protein